MTLHTSSTTVGVTIRRDPDAVYDYVADPPNFSLWAPGLCRSIRPRGENWTIETPAGEMGLRMAPANSFRVADHWVSPADGKTIYVPMRVLAHPAGSEVILTIFHRDMSPAEVARDLELVAHDLAKLKELLEDKGR